MNVDALKTNLTELGTKIAKETKVKADALKEKAGEAIANAKKNKEARAGEDPAVVSDAEGDPSTPSRRKSSLIQDTIAGVADKIKLPGVRVEEGSIADILLKAKAKVFRSSGVDGADSAAVASDETAVVVAGDPAEFENMKTRVDDLTSEMESTANDKESPKEKVQKNLIIILAKLKAAQDKFVAMVEAKKKERAEAAAASGDAAAPDAAAAEDGTKGQKLKNLLSTAESAARKAFENAERVAREAAKKTGLFDGEKKKSAADTLSDIADANAEPKTDGEPSSPPPAAAPPSPPEPSAPPAEEEGAPKTAGEPEFTI